MDQTTSPFLMQLLRIVIFAIAMAIYVHLIPSLRMVWCTDTIMISGIRNDLFGPMLDADERYEASFVSVKPEPFQVH